MNEEFVEVGEDVPLEGGDGGQEAAEEVEVENRESKSLPLEIYERSKQSKKRNNSK